MSETTENTKKKEYTLTAAQYAVLQKIDQQAQEIEMRARAAIQQAQEQAQHRKLGAVQAIAAELGITGPFALQGNQIILE